LWQENKVKIKVQKERDGVRVDFDQELPVFPSAEGRYVRQYERVAITRTLNVQRYAERMVNVNHGRFQLELIRSADYEPFLRDLLLVEGLEGICDAGRYSIAARTSDFFEWRKIGEEIGQLVQQHFYPHESCEESRGLEDIV